MSMFQRWKYAWVVGLSLPACSKVTLDCVSVLRECCPDGHDFSLNNLFVVVMYGSVSLSLVDVALKGILQSVRDSQHLLTYVYYIGCA